MLRAGIIEESTRPWSSPTVVVLKPDGRLRLCSNFRKLNAISDFNSYPLFKVDDLVDRLARACFVSTLDLTKGYWQVARTPQAQPKIAFTTASGHWRYRVFPFGLHAAPATFQCLMIVVSPPTTRDFTAAYLDNVIIHLST